MNGENYDVFISYRRKDTDLKAGMINNALKARFIRCFYDFDEIKDRKFDDNIRSGILGHQFSEVYTRTTFQDNIDALIRDRIKSAFCLRRSLEIQGGQGCKGTIQ